MYGFGIYFNGGGKQPDVAPAAIVTVMYLIRS